MRITKPGGDPVDLDTVDLFDHGLYATGDPHAIWAAMRGHAPVHRQTLPDGRGFWSVTRYHDVNDVLRDHTRFTSSQGTLLSILGSTDPAGGKMMAASDPPVHSALREPMGKVLSHSALQEHNPRIRRVVLRMLGPLLDGGVWDIARAAARFPMAFTGTLMGLPESDWPRLAGLTTMAIAPQDPEYRQSDGHGTLAAAHHQLFAYFSEQARNRKRHPSDDLVGFLVRMRAGDRPLKHDEIVYNCYSLLLGANVTTPHAVAGTVLALIEHPDEYRRWRQEPRRTSTAVEEGLRWASPANHFMRHATQDMTLHGVQIKEGDAVVAWLGSANRDEQVFPDPFRFDTARSPNRHVAFGFGPHYCIGAPLARIALRMLFTEIVAAVGEFALAGPVEHLTSNFVAGIKSMPVTARLDHQAAREIATAIAEEGQVAV
ncbi:cytochrome P450 [Kibdelosporangium phytohabitans]|uniref:Cytochrome n=1 Tax=Kibdelosporangium phytohabitans TaxID=860235 RepID=A0A0N7F3E0_9PSEU|nr:cytochrome P450 [Kibdelosporangium phytohabitans]ALG08367.1 cytochrome [Kibdelosporangium phytohabitans]MBE1470588.1 cytochrome P450 [Kibdelosporangium phytohabitans]